jgi:lipoic acid synthetase
MADDYLGLQHGLRDLDLITVCEEAGCPNIYECWSDGTATFMINGTRCSRACGFCQVDTRRPLPLDAGEPERVAEAVERMNLAHAVITCVARDDLPDGGAGAFASTIAAVRRRAPRTVVEVLISDCKGDESSLQTVFGARPDVLNHNIETVARLQRAVRPSAGYARSLAVLARAKETGLTAKSGIILGMGEREDEVLSTLADLRGVGVDIVTLGQYLRPSGHHLPVARWWAPEEFDRLRDAGMAMGFAHVQASPLTRSSYHAREAAEASAPDGTIAGSVAGGMPSDSAATAATTAS